MDVIKNRFSGEVMFGGLSLKVVLEKHVKWHRGEEGGTRADLTRADLRGAVLTRAVLTRADLRGADLTGADLRGAVLSCPVKIDNIHQVIFAAASQPDALNMKKWHTCGTTHCRAGWVIAITGDAGKALEWAFGGEGRGTPLAAAMIYMASDPALEKVPDFYCDNEKALADMKRLADLEAARNV